MKVITLTILTFFISLASSAQVKIKSRTIEEKLNEEYCTGVFKTTNGTIVPIDGAPSVNGFDNILDYLQGRVPGLKIETTRTHVQIPLIRGQQATLFVDEIHVNPSYLSSLNITDIAMVKIIKTPFALSPNNAPAIAIYLLKVEEEEGK